MRTDIIPNPAGLCALTADGRLGVYDDQKRFRVDADLTDILQVHNAQLLERYFKNGNWNHARLALIHPTRSPREWGPVSLWLDEAVMRRLYLSGDIDAALSTFQKRNQEKSIYRGMELLLEYRDKEAATIPRFCPVLFDGRQMLHQYLHCLGRREQDGDRDTPVIEVVNLFADLLPSQRQTPELRAFAERIHANLIRKDARREIGFTLYDSGSSVTPPALSRPGAPTATSRGTPSPAALREAQLIPHDAVNVSIENLHNLHITERVERIERWLQFPYHHIDPAQLRELHHFHKLDQARLELLASKSLIYTAPPEARLLKPGMNDRWNLYLLEGKLSLRTEDGQRLIVESGTPKAAFPVAFLKPRKYLVTARTSVRFLWIHDAALPTVMATTPVPLQPASLPMKLEGVLA